MFNSYLNYLQGGGGPEDEIELLKKLQNICEKKIEDNLEIHTTKSNDITFLKNDVYFSLKFFKYFSNSSKPALIENITASKEYKVVLTALRLGSIL